MSRAVRWAPRVPMEWVQRLYEADAAGIVDDELIDKVGWRLYERCRDCIAVSDASGGGRVTCPECRSAIEPGDGRALSCACGFSCDWAPFAKSWQHMELCSAGMRDFFAAFVAMWDRARTPKEKMLAIDELIHRWHWENKLDERGAVGRPGGVNLIEGSRKQVIEFLDRLSAGPNHDRWKANLERVTAARDRAGSVPPDPR